MVTSNHFFNFFSKSREQSNNIGCLENTLPEHIANTFAEFFSTVFNDNTIDLIILRQDNPLSLADDKVSTIIVISKCTYSEL